MQLIWRERTKYTKCLEKKGTQKVQSQEPEYDTVGGYEAKKPEFQGTVRGYRAKKPEVLGTAIANEAIPIDRVWSRTSQWPLELARS